MKDITETNNISYNYCINYIFKLTYKVNII
jgi:hypothetical protein